MEEAREEQLDFTAFGEYLTGQYEIIRRVFSFLSIFELKACMEVCEDWKEAATATMKERRGIHCVMLTGKSTKPVILSDAALSLSFCSLSTANGYEESLNDMAEQTLHFVARYGIIAVFKDSKPSLRRHRAELPLTPRAYLNAAVRFPEWEGATVKTVTIGLNTLTESEMEEAIDLPQDAPLQGVILMTYDGEGEIDRNVNTLMVCLRRRRKEFPLGGCRLEIEEGIEEVCIKCLIFLGPKVEAASCVLDNNCRTPEDINAKVENLSKSVIQLKDSVVLAFRCCDRQKVRRRYNYLPRENVETWETNAIKKFFPLAPAIGCYGVGEYGTDCPALYTAKKPRLLGGSRMSIQYGYSTILVYIGFKK